ncbi:MAG: carbon-nitrogen family hydrolase [Planctomycetota bacterium]|nr:MAG: carbon-nitrogen family hydrolase [Planctomycetota bacterium]
MRALLVQADIAWEDRDENHHRVREALEAVAPTDGDLIVLPEMFDSGFSLNVERTADDAGASRAFLADLARRRRSTVYAGLTIRREDGMGLNRAVVIGPDGAVLVEYDKLHPFSYGREPERFAPGQRGVVVCPWRAGEETLTLCPAVCYDLRFPELFRAGLGLGAEVYVIGANWPAARARHWRALLEARAIENQAFVIGVNRVGADPHLEYAGGSVALSPMGRVLVEAGDGPGVHVARIEPDEIRAWRAEFPAWRDRRGDLAPG